jgi:hypothetical protein
MLPLLVALLLQAAATPAAESEASATDAAVALVPRVSAAVEELRGLKFKRPVAVKVVTSTEARAHFQERAKALWPEERVKLDQQVYADLGLLPAGFDLLPGFLDLLEEQALGYYDPGSDTFFLVSGSLPIETAPMLMAHELTHALDDQHFDIDAMLKLPEGEDDRSAAISALVEGSGTVVMTAFLSRELQAGRMTMAAVQQMQKSEALRAQKLRAAPAVIQRSLLASYVVGMAFLLRGDPRRLSSGVPVADLNHAFADPPRSTAQLLHPETYWEPAKRETPLPVLLPDLSKRLGKGWSLASHGNLGELILASLAGGGALDMASPAVLWPAAWTNAAATGTTADAYQLYATAGKSITLLATLWRSERDAAEFQDGLRTIPRRRSFRAGNAVVALAGDDPGDGISETVAAEALSAIALTSGAAQSRSGPYTP